jgi:hypothetical protein
LNKFSDLTKEEFLTKYTGLRFSAEPRGPTTEFELTDQENVDWRTKGAVTEVKN